MRITTRRGLAGITTLGVAALVLSGCAPAPETTAGSDATNASDFLPCMVSDFGGFDDKSFNQAGYEGLESAAAELGVTPKTVESAAETDFAPNIQGLIDQGCKLVVTVGFALSEATGAAATANPDVEFAIIDDNQLTETNVKPIVFDTAQAAFLAGYTAASYSKTGIVGTYGGQPYPSVTIFMDGFAEGVKYFNTQKGKDVKVLGWDVQSQNGVFTGGFEAGTEAKSAAQNLIDQNADVLLPVGGPIFQSAIEAIKDSGKDVAMIGVDSDLYETAATGNELFLTSILKQVGGGVSDVVTSAANGEFDNTPYVGTLKNDGVGIAPFHDFSSKVSGDLQGELDTIKASIISGEITVSSPSSPKS